MQDTSMKKSFETTLMKILVEEISHTGSAFATTEEGEGVFLSRNDGKSWESVSDELSENNVYAVALHPKTASRMAAGGWDAGVWMSDDTGKTWVDRSAGLPSKNVTAMAYDPTRKDRLWVSTFEEGTYFSDDSGATWKDGNLYGAYVLDMDVIPVSD